MIRVLFIAHSATAPSTRYRATELLPALAEAGMSVETRYHTKSAFDPFRMRWLWKMNRYDVVIVRRRLFPSGELQHLRKRARKLVFDFDDSIHLGRKGGKREERKQKQFAELVSLADLVIAGNEFLKTAALESGAKRVEILPTPLPTSDYSIQRNTNGFTLGWIGSRENLVYLKEILPALESLGEKYPKLTLRIISNDSLLSDRIAVENIPWSPEREIRELEGVDIGLGPLPDDPWTRGKCGFKLLQYMAAGIPVIASPIGMQKEIVVEGSTGFLAGTDEEWRNSVQTLLDDPPKRLSMGNAGRERVEDRYDSKSIGAKLAGLLKDLYIPTTGKEPS